MHLSKLETELVANYLEEYLDYLEYLYTNIRALYTVYRMDEDDEISKIEDAMNTIETKIRSIRNAKDFNMLKDLVNLKKIIKEGLDKGGNFYVK